jgi:hypothetical protein
MVTTRARLFDTRLRILPLTGNSDDLWHVFDITNSTTINNFNKKDRPKINKFLKESKERYEEIKETQGNAAAIEFTNKVMKEYQAKLEMVSPASSNPVIQRSYGIEVAILILAFLVYRSYVNDQDIISVALVLIALVLIIAETYFSEHFLLGSLE